FSQGTTKCNCTSCWKKRWWSVSVKPNACRPREGAEVLGGYRSGQDRGHAGFCKHCGVFQYACIEAAEWNDGEYVSLNVAALDNLEPAELTEAPVRYTDGRADNWWSSPAETRHL